MRSGEKRRALAQKEGGRDGREREEAAVDVEERGRYTEREGKREQTGYCVESTCTLVHSLSVCLSMFNSGIATPAVRLEQRVPSACDCDCMRGRDRHKRRDDDLPLGVKCASIKGERQRTCAILPVFVCHTHVTRCPLSLPSSPVSGC